MKIRKYAAVLLLLVCILWCSGCGGIEKAKESTVAVDKDGKVTALLIEDFPEEAYDGEELEQNIRDLVDTYNGAEGKDRVTLSEFEVKKEKARVMMTYQSAADYRAFNQVDFFAGTVEEAIGDSYSFAGNFKNADGKEADISIPDDCREYQVMVVREPVCVMVPGRIHYVSANMEIRNKKCAALTDDSGLDDTSLSAVTAAYGYVIYEN